MAFSVQAGSGRPGGARCGPTPERARVGVATAIGAEQGNGLVGQGL
ncbi:hypothetical protein [Rhodococcus aetherivorans]|nr:hypothetical protein [Rhodococcus aetherivorans]CCW14421.1 hypothetical protein EBESD8_49900 [Rhodococcus aetherivorans]